MRDQPVLYQRKPKDADSQRKSRWLFWLLVAGVPAAVVAYMTLFAGMGYLYVAGGKQVPVSTYDWEVIVDAHDVAEWMPGLEVATEAEALRKVRHLDRSYDLSYEYLPDDGQLFVSSSLAVERNVTDAIASYLPLWGATWGGFKLAGEDGVTLEALEGFYHWGHQSKFGVLRRDGEPVGHLFVARHGNKVVFVLMSGIYFEDADTWAQFITPTLSRVASYGPE